MTTTTFDHLSADEAVAEATALAAAGRFRDAIALATHVNRRTRDPRLEFHLVRWRHFACGSPPDPIARAAAERPVAADRFEASSRPPEISAAELTAEAVASAIEQHGTLLVRGLLSPPQAETLASDIDRAFNAFAAARAGTPRSETMAWYAPLRESSAALAKARSFVERLNQSLCAADSPRTLFDILDMYESIGLIDVLEAYLQERPVLSVEKATLRRVPPGANGQWHQDGRFLGERIKALNVWVALSPCGVDAPGLDIVARRIPYIVQTGTDGAIAKWTIGTAQVMSAADDTEVVTPCFAAGDALLFDQLLVHRTSTRPGQTRSRWAVESWFFAPSAMPSHHALAV